MPVIWWNGMRARLKTLAISGTGQAAQWASHSPVILRAVAQLVERLVVDGRGGLQVQNDHRHLGAADDRQHGRRQGVGRDVQEDQIDVGLAEVVAGTQRLFGRVDQAEVDDLDARAASFSSVCCKIAFSRSFEPVELRPVGVEPDAEQADCAVAR